MITRQFYNNFTNFPVYEVIGIARIAIHGASSGCTVVTAKLRARRRSAIDLKPPDA
jgi:hypothetical protein